MTDRVEKMVSQVQTAIGAPLVVDVASFCLGVLPSDERRNPVSILGAVYDWLRGVWTSEPRAIARDRKTTPEAMLHESLAYVFAVSDAIANGRETVVPKPNRIGGDQFAAAVLAATMPAAVGIKTRFRFGGENGWERVWVEADPLGNGSWGYDLDLYALSPIGEVPAFSKYGDADIFDGYLATLPERAKEARMKTAPPNAGEHFRTVLPDSWEGIKFELGRMREYVETGTKDALVIETAEEIILGLPAEKRGDLEARLEAAYQWIRERCVYRSDPVGLEVIQTANRMIRMSRIPAEVMGAVLAPAMAVRAGQTLESFEPQLVAPFIAADCDECGILCASIVSSEPIGIPTQFRLGGTDGSEGYHHVWVQAQIGGRWGWDMDPTESEYDAVGKFADMDKRGRLAIFK